MSEIELQLTAAKASLSSGRSTADIRESALLSSLFRDKIHIDENVLTNTKR